MSQHHRSRWREWTVVPVGAGWAFAIGIIEQPGGRLKIRAAKGKTRDVEEGELPIHQWERFSMKVTDWEGDGDQPGLREIIDRYVAQIKEEREE